MTNPALDPKRLGSIKGANNRDLSQVWQKLNDIEGRVVTSNTTLTAINTNLSNILTAINRLAGTEALPANWRGVPAAWGAAPSGTSATLYERLGDILTALALIGPDDNAPVVAQLQLANASLDSLETVVNSNVLAIYQTLVGVSGNLSGMYVSLGDISSDPGFGTIKALIGQILACCEEGGVVTPPPVFNPPAEGCGGAPANWREASLQLVAASSTEPIKIYNLVWPGGHAEAPDLVATTRALVGGGTQPGMGASGSTPTGETDLVCVAWSFDASTPLYNMAFDNTSTASDLARYGYTSYSNVTPQVDSVSQQFVFKPTSGPANVMHVNFAFETGAAPVGKVWVQVKPRVD